MTKPLMILVAGPYRSGTDGDPEKIAANLKAMTDTALALYEAGHLPMLGEWLALPLIKAAGSTEEGDPIFDRIFHPSAERLLSKCDGCLRIGGASSGADRMVRTAESLGVAVYYALEEIP
ncbi:MAG: DUF4406 domain-containing protein [Chloroflexota bacterium]